MAVFNISILILGLCFLPNAGWSQSFNFSLGGSAMGLPMMNKWISSYQGVDKSLEFKVEALGATEGFNRWQDGKLDVALVTGPLSSAEISRAGSGYQQVAVAILGVGIVYNIPGFQDTLRLSPEVLADMVLGKVTRWDDERIQVLNPKAKIPKGLGITFCHRSDESASTQLLSEYLSLMSTEFKKQIGLGRQLSWPTGIGVKGGENLAAVVKQNPGAIGYVATIFAKSASVPLAAIKNRGGEFVVPSPSNLAAAGEAGILEGEVAGGVSLINREGKRSYPLSAFSYVLVRHKHEGLRGPKLAEFLTWILGSGQKSAASLEYAPIPDNLSKRQVTGLAVLSAQ